MNRPQKLNPKTGQPYPNDLATGYFGKEGSKALVKITVDIDELIAQFGDTGKATLVGFDAKIDKDGNPRKNITDKTPDLRFVKKAEKPQGTGSRMAARTAAPAARKAGGGYPF